MIIKGIFFLKQLFTGDILRSGFFGGVGEKKPLLR